MPFFQNLYNTAEGNVTESFEEARDKFKRKKRDKEDGGGFFKEIWKNLNNPDQTSAFAQQYAASLLAAQGQRPGLASMGSKIMGGLIMRGQNKASKKEEEQMKKDREEFFGLLRPEVTTKPGIPIGTSSQSPFTPMSTPEAVQKVRGGVLAGGVDPFAPMSSEEHIPGKITPERVGEIVKAQKPDIWSAMVKASKSKDPMLQNIASQFMSQQLVKFGATLDPKDRHFVTPQGIVLDRQVLIDTGDFGKATLYNPVIDKKYQETWAVEEDGKIFGMKPGGEVELIATWNPKEESKPEEVWTLDEKKFEETGIPYQNGRIMDMKTGRTIANLGSRLQPGTAQGTYKTPTQTQAEVGKMMFQSEDALKRLLPMLDQFQNDPELQDYFTLQGKIGYSWGTLKDKLKQIDRGSPEYNKLVKIADYVSEVERNSARMIKEMTGAQMSEAEASRLLKGIANSSDSRAQFEGKLRNAIDEISTVYKSYLERYQSFGAEASDAWLKRELEDILYRAESGGMNEAERPAGVKFD